ncbi:MAG: UDP-N-acetylglucosamine 2-epimerase [Campylobacteraceae bacterium]|nr:UDP-N-acetylglucosamine 2-epimerase [Campylobacteraceae bacterium]
MIFHPIKEEKENVDKYFRNILENLKQRNINTFVSYPNVDPGNQKLIDVINRFKEDKNFIFYKNLERDIFMSIYKNSKFIIGNSSSGICEAASFKIPAINVGLRQVGRYADKNVIFCGNDFQEIGNAIDRACSNEFLESLKDLKNSYGDGNSAIKAFELIKQIDFKSIIAKVEDPLKVELL